MRILRRLKGFVGMFQSLSGVLMTSLMIFFSVVSGGGAVRVCGEFVELGGSLVRVIWHDESGPHCVVQLRTSRLVKLSNKRHFDRE
jgi:hypothetical protein